MEEKQTIFVGVSGGVDSSVTAALLKEAGHNVVGVFIRTWQPDWIECTWKDERRDAMRVCAHLDIPFIELDLEQSYKEGVVNYMIREYKEGRTPNPDVMCNREVKFGSFLSWAKEQGANYVATGHYAQRYEDENVQLLRGKDEGKDQSYFLWTLTQEQLQHVLFPLGHLTKQEVRERAEYYNLPTAQKPDSQGICFIGEVDMKEFLHHYIEEKEGELCTPEGKVVGTHPGALFFTIGERHGFHVDPSHKRPHDAPYYVVDKDIEKNIIVISQTPHEYQQKERTTVDLIDVVINQPGFDSKKRYEAQMRYHGEVYEVEVVNLDETTKTAVLHTSSPFNALASGQSIVLYDGEQCLGGGIVK